MSFDPFDSYHRTSSPESGGQPTTKVFPPLNSEFPRNLVPWESVRPILQKVAEVRSSLQHDLVEPIARSVVVSAVGDFFRELRLKLQERATSEVHQVHHQELGKLLSRGNHFTLTTKG